MLFRSWRTEKVAFDSAGDEDVGSGIFDDL